MKYLILVLAFLLSGCITGATGNLAQPEAKRTIKVLTINLCADWNAPRQARADKIVEFARAEQVDIILAQEGIKGLGQFDMVKYIAAQLNYSYIQSPVFGFPGFYEFSVGIISNSPITDAKIVGCQVVGGDFIDNIPFPGAGRGVLANICGIWVMSSHLTVPTAQDQRESQVRCLQAALPQGMAIWGGDFNFNRDNPAYSLIKMDEAQYPGSAQVDMIFTRHMLCVSSEMVFEDHYVSDHSGVLAEFTNGSMP